MLMLSRLIMSLRPKSLQINGLLQFQLLCGNCEQVGHWRRYTGGALARVAIEKDAKSSASSLSKNADRLRVTRVLEKPKALGAQRVVTQTWRSFPDRCGRAPLPEELR